MVDGITQAYMGVNKVALLLQEYDFKVVQKALLKNLDVDGLSRNPSLWQEDLTGAFWHSTYH